MRFFFKLLSRLSLEWLYRIVGRPFFDWGYYILRWRRRLAANNIARSFPELSAEARAAILKQSYRNLADIIPRSSGATARRLRSCASASTCSIPKSFSSASALASQSC